MQPHEGRLALALRALNSELAASNRVVADKLGLNDSDLAVLDVLHRYGPQTPTALAHRTRMAVTTMTSVLRRLTRDGWVERRANEQDLRSFTIHPTSVDRLASIFRPANEEFADLVADWPPQQVDDLVGFLETATRVIHDKADHIAGISSARPTDSKRAESDTLVAPARN